MAEKALSRVLVALGCATSIGVLGSLSALPTACAQKQCEASTQDYGRDPGQGELIDENTWESTPELANWLEYPGERKIFFYPHGLEHRRVARVTVYISANVHPNATKFGEPADPATSQYTIASGDVAQITTFPDPADERSPGITVYNHTCAAFWTRVVVEAYPEPPRDGGALPDASAVPDQDGGADASNDARTLDASSDGPNDGASE